MALIQLGNVAVLEPYKEDEGVDTFKVKPRPDLGARTHEIGIPPGMEFAEAIGHIGRFIEASFAVAPTWVESDEELYSTYISRQYGAEVGRPDDWEEGAEVEGVWDTEEDDDNGSE